MAVSLSLLRAGFKPTSLFVFLEKFDATECQDARDKTFSLLSIATDVHVPQPESRGDNKSFNSQFGNAIARTKIQFAPDY